jgi:hypothetical protein
MGGIHIGEYSPGFFWMYQGGLQVAQLVVGSSVGGTVEYWFPFAAGTGSPPSGYSTYTWPGPQHTAVTTSFSYHGTTPPNWDPNNPAAYKSVLQNQLGQGLTVQFITCNCGAPSVKGKTKKVAKKKPSKPTKKSAKKRKR